MADPSPFPRTHGSVWWTASLNVAEAVLGKVQELSVAESAVTGRKQSAGRMQDEVVEEGPMRDGHLGPCWTDSADMAFLELAR